MEDIHEFYVQLYSNSAEHSAMMIEISAECANRRQHQKSVCGGDATKRHEYLSICTIASLFLARETATRALVSRRCTRASDARPPGGSFLG